MSSGDVDEDDKRLHVTWNVACAVCSAYRFLWQHVEERYRFVDICTGHLPGLRPSSFVRHFVSRKSEERLILRIFLARSSSHERAQITQCNSSTAKLPCTWSLRCYVTTLRDLVFVTLDAVLSGFRQLFALKSDMRSKAGHHSLASCQGGNLCKHQMKEDGMCRLCCFRRCIQAPKSFPSQQPHICWYSLSC